MTLTVDFDINPSGSLCHGSLIYENNRISAICDDKVLFTSALTGIKELLVRTYVGCGTLELVSDEHSSDLSDSQIACRFSMSCVEQIGEFSKVVNHYLQTGEETEISTKDFRICPTCGRHYAKGINTCFFCVEKTFLAKRLFETVRKYLPVLAVSGIFITLASAMSALVPVFNQKLIDNYLYNTSLSKEELVHGIALLALAMLATQMLNQIFSIVSHRIANRSSGRISNDLRTLVYDKIQRLSVSSLSRKNAGDLMKRVSRDTEVVKNFVTEHGIYSIEKLVMFVVILVILLRINVLLTVIILVPVPLVVLALSQFWKHIRVRYRKQWKSESKESSILHDIIKGIRVVKTFGSEDREIAKFSLASRTVAKVCTSNEHLWALVFPFISFFMGIGEFIVIFVGGRMVIEGKITAGQLLEFNLFLAYIYQPLRWMSTLPRRLGEVATSLIKIYEIIDEVDDLSDVKNPAPAILSGNIVFENVQFGYKPYEPVLKNINLNISNGEMIGLVGHSGAGKSTLINLIMRLYDVDAGKIMINGTDIRDMSQTQYREKIGVVFQETFLFSGSVYDNIAYARPSAMPGEVIAAAKAANAHDFIMKLSDGYNTIIGEDGHNLSGGERQRISIARAVLRNPEILILDEATSALDPETEEAIQDALSKLVKGRTTFAIAHRLSTLRNADRLVVIEKGKIAEVGTHRELLLNNGIYAGLVMAQRQTSKLEH